MSDETGGLMLAEPKEELGPVDYLVKDHRAAVCSTDREKKGGCKCDDDPEHRRVMNGIAAVTLTEDGGSRNGSSTKTAPTGLQRFDHEVTRAQVDAREAEPYFADGLGLDAATIDRLHAAYIEKV